MARKASQTRKRKEALAKKQQKRRNMIIGGVVALLVMITAVFAISSQSNEAETADGLRIAPKVGALAPDFQLAGLNGETVQLSDYRGQPVAVVFMHTW